MIVSAVVLALAKPPPPAPLSGTQPLKRLLVASSIPVAFGAFAPAVQLCGPLNDAQAILLQCGTYSVATADVAAVRAVRERSIRVDGRTWRAGVELGLWITAAATLESLGLQRTTATPPSPKAIRPRRRAKTALPVVGQKEKEEDVGLGFFRVGLFFLFSSVSFFFFFSFVVFFAPSFWFFCFV